MNFEMIPAKELDRYTDRQDTFLIDVRPPGRISAEPHPWRCQHSLSISVGLLPFSKRKDVDSLLRQRCHQHGRRRELAKKGCKVKTVIGGIRSYRGKKLEIFH